MKGFNVYTEICFFVQSVFLHIYKYIYKYINIFCVFWRHEYKQFKHQTCYQNCKPDSTGNAWALKDLVHFISCLL